VTPNYQTLHGLAHNLHEEERKLAQLEYDLYQARLALIRARDDLDREISLVSLAAYNEGKIDGKNESMRKLQLDAVLTDSESVQALREEVAKLEDTIGGQELALGYQRAQARYSRNLFDAALAAARAASAQTVHLASEAA
jgi:hypothetical protein